MPLRSFLRGLVMGAVVLFWGLGPPIFKLITSPPLPPVVGVLYRFWLSVPILCLLAKMVGHPPRRSTLAKTLLPGAAFGVLGLRSRGPQLGSGRGAERSSMFLLSMNIVAIGAAWLIHDEPLTAIQLLGGVVVFGAV